MDFGCVTSFMSFTTCFTAATNSNAKPIAPLARSAKPLRHSPTPKAKPICTSVLTNMSEPAKLVNTRSSAMITQKRHPKPMTPYKSMSKRGCDRIGPQACPTHGHSHPLHSVVCDDHGHLFAPVCHHPVSRDAR